MQLVGIEAVLDTIGLGRISNWLVQDMPLFIAFAVLAAFTYSSGLRAPALIAFVKDTLIYLVIVVAIIWVAVHIGFGDVFTAAKTKMETPTPAGTPTGVFIPSSGPVGYWAYASLALGSALALFMYPHSITAVLSGKTRNTIRRNAAILPAYSLLLGLLALLGFAAIAAGTSVFGTDGKANAQLAVPHLFQENFPSWFAGIAYQRHRHRRTRAVGDHVDRRRQPVHPQHLQGVHQEGRHARRGGQGSKIMSLVVKFGALLFVLTLDKQNAINFQLLGGVWILQTFLAIVAGLVHPVVPQVRPARRLGGRHGLRHDRVATSMTVPNIVTRLVDGEPQATQNGERHFGSSLAEFPFTDTKVYIALTALLLNIIVAVVLTWILRAANTPAGTDTTKPDDYYADSGVDLPMAGEYIGDEGTPDPVRT